MRIAVVGGAGYVGSVLVRELLDHGHGVSVIDSGLYGYHGILDLWSAGRIEVRQDDAKGAEPKWFSESSMERYQDGSLVPDERYPVEAVINLAGFSNDPTAEFRPDLNWELNVTTAAKIADAAKRAGVRRLIYASSCSVYHCTESPFDSEVTESHPVKPHWHYATSKYAGELASLSFHEPGIFDVCVLRKGTVCGPSPRMRYDLMLNTMYRSAVRDRVINLHGGGWVYRPLLGINDAARAYRMLVEAPREVISGQVFNAVSENGTVRDFAFRLARQIDAPLKNAPPPAQVRSYRVSARKLREWLGWSPEDTIETIASDLHHAWKHNRIQSFEDPSTENIAVIRRMFS